MSARWPKCTLLVYIDDATVSVQPEDAPAEFQGINALLCRPDGHIAWASETAFDDADVRVAMGRLGVRIG